MEKMELDRMAADIEVSKSRNGNNKPMYLVWEDLTVVLPIMRNGTTRKLLSELSGYAEPGRIMAIMGPSGSGKSTLLDSLAGRISPNVIMTGNVLLNGKKRSIDCRDVSYVSQEDVFLGTLTVRETITCSAHLRLPSEMTKEEINKVIEKTITVMGLHDCADNKIGNWHLRGISTGEKRRLSISLEIVTHPRVLFLDEPTSGLDSASAFFVIDALRNVALDGRTVVCSIHQPSSEVFDLFDDLLLLSSGEAVYFGQAKTAIKFFANAGFACPTRRNPSDHFLRCICLDFDNITAALMRTQRNCGIPASSGSYMNMTTAEIKSTLVEKYKCSEYAVTARTRIRELALIEGVDIESNKGSNANRWKQLCTLTHRSFLNMTRDMGYYWLRIIFYILVGVSVGTLFFNIGKHNGAILGRGKSISFIYGFMICLSNGGLPFFIEEMKVFYRERFNGHYGEAVFVMSNFVSSFPFLVLISLFSGTVIYYMVNFHPGFSHYGFFCINLFCCISVIETYMMIVASLVPNVLMGIGTGTALIVFMMMPSQIFRPVTDLPKFFWRYPMSYISFATWAIQGQYKNDMIGLEFDPLLPGDQKIKGETVLRTIFGVPMDHSKWLDLTALTCLLLANRVLFYIILKYKERISSKLYGKRTFRRLARRFSVRREGLISSKRHQPLHPLSSQEGIKSPMH